MRFRRKQLAVTQTDLGEALGITFQQVQKYERGANRVSASTLFRMAIHLEVGVNYFFEGLPDQPAGNGDVGVDAAILAAFNAVPGIGKIGHLSPKAQSALQLMICALEGDEA